MHENRETGGSGRMSREIKARGQGVGGGKEGRNGYMKGDRSYEGEEDGKDQEIVRMTRETGKSEKGRLKKGRKGGDETGMGDGKQGETRRAITIQGEQKEVRETGGAGEAVSTA